MNYRIIYTGSIAYDFSPVIPNTVVFTNHSVFEGTEEECWNLISSLGMDVTDPMKYPFAPWPTPTPSPSSTPTPTPTPEPTPTPSPITPLQQYTLAINAGYTASDNNVYGITDADQLSWTKALMALSNAETALVTNLSSVSVESVLGAILKKDGTLAPSMTVQQFRILMLQMTQYIGQLRSALASAS